MRQETKCVHSGTLVDELAGGLNSPIYPSTAGEYLGRSPVPYQRYFNTPNQQAVVAKVAALEGAEDGVLFSSGMAAISTVMLALLQPGDHAVVQAEIYGGTYAFVTEVFDRVGIAYTLTDLTPEAVEDALRPNTKVVFLETPTNPLLNVIDLRRVAGIVAGRGIVTVADNTFATPLYQRPLELGMDISVHSGTKYLSGHSDIQCGIAVGSAELAGRIRHHATHLGGNLNAETCYLLERSLKTLHLRVERQTENAGKLAEFLFRHEAVANVYYPGLASHSGHEIAARQMSGFGAMMSFDLKPRGTSAEALQRNLKLVRPAVSLGGVETTICSPTLTSHAKVKPEERLRLGITDSLLRLSVGVEHIDDLIEDFSQALTTA